MNNDDREELLWRRVSEKVVNAADDQIKRRYFWAALIFAVVSWFGGAALITSVVQTRVAEKMEPAQMAVVQAKLLSEQLSSSLLDAQKNAAKLNDSLKDTNQKLDAALNSENNLEKQLTALQSNAELAFKQFNERVKDLGQVVAQSDTGQSAKAQAIAKLEIPHVTIRVGGDLPPNLAAQLPRMIEAMGRYSVTGDSPKTFIGTSSLRYFYREDAVVAANLATTTTEALKEFGITNKPVPIVDLSGFAIKPPEATFEIWLNISNGRIL